MQKKSDTDTIRPFINQCRQQGLKVTPQRVSIFNALAGSNEHPTADMIYRAVIREYPNISFETVNRTLLKFVDLGILNVIESYSGARRFDPDLESHHHIHCIRCGKIVDFMNDGFDALEIPKAFEKNYQVVSKRVVINVICKTCQSK